MRTLSKSTLQALSKYSTQRDIEVLSQENVIDWEADVGVYSFADCYIINQLHSTKSAKEVYELYDFVSDLGGEPSNSLVLNVLPVAMFSKKDFSISMVEKMFAGRDFKEEGLEQLPIISNMENFEEDAELTKRRQTNMAAIGKQAILRGASLDTVLSSGLTAWEAMKFQKPEVTDRNYPKDYQTDAYKEFMEWAKDLNLRPGAGSPRLVNLPTQEKDLAALLKETLLKDDIVNTWEDGNDYSVGMYTLPKEVADTIGKDHVALFSEEGAWWGACSAENSIVVGNRYEVEAAAKEFMRGSALDVKKEFAPSYPVPPAPLISLGRLDIVTEGDDFTVAGAKIGDDTIIYQYGESGLGVTDTDGYNKLLDLTVAVNNAKTGPIYERLVPTEIGPEI